MKIRIRLRVHGKEAAADEIRIDDAKLEPLDPDEREAAVEVAVRSWADKAVELEWETEDEPE
ncbi:hypothetical protein SD70_25920 [Gordoniibacillus kamchatkensis]|uniref:DUF7167 domain-containing protein n=2 Tax=Gordoniibacillus kamchatkensis TaxID=1590651 RepID=A0ABR5ACC2_9BACL|nr:hypothetical protein SD70_25920 [Paenibacillus sp. VKM B-2647]